MSASGTKLPNGDEPEWTRGEALAGNTIRTLDFEFNIAMAFEIIHGNQGKAWKGKALGSRIPLGELYICNY
jgi:hypothetical protein